MHLRGWATSDRCRVRFSQLADLAASDDDSDDDDSDDDRDNGEGASSDNGLDDALAAALAASDGDSGSDDDADGALDAFLKSQMQGDSGSDDGAPRDGETDDDERPYNVFKDDLQEHKQAAFSGAQARLPNMASAPAGASFVLPRDGEDPFAFDADAALAEANATVRSGCAAVAVGCLAGRAWNLLSLCNTAGSTLDAFASPACEAKRGSAVKWRCCRCHCEHCCQRR